MSSIEEVTVMSVTDLGPGNQGEFGPGSDNELKAAQDVTDERYWGPRLEESACMDDRLKGMRLHLAGNRAVTENAAGYMDRRVAPEPQSRTMGRKVQELKAMGRLPVFHKKCAALAAVRSSLRYNAEHEDEVVDTLWLKLDALGATEFLTQRHLRNAILTGKRNSEDESLWDVSAHDLMELAKANGAEIEDAPGQHHVAFNLDNMSHQGFNNGLFRDEHLADDSEPMGALTVDWLGYRDQLLEDGYSEEETARMLMRGGLFIVGVQKMINKDGSPLIVVGRAA